MLIESGKGAFELCGLVAGGQFYLDLLVIRKSQTNPCLGSEAMEAAIKLARQVRNGLLEISGIMVTDNCSLFSIGTSRINPNASTSFPGTCPSTAIRSPHYLYLDISQNANLMRKSSNTRMFTWYHRPLASASNESTRPRNNMWRDSDRNWRTSSSSSGPTQS